jgi:hypothetical protein
MIIMVIRNPPLILELYQDVHWEFVAKLTVGVPHE